MALAEAMHDVVEHTEHRLWSKCLLGFASGNPAFLKSLRAIHVWKFPVKLPSESGISLLLQHNYDCMYEYKYVLDFDLPRDLQNWEFLGFPIGAVISIILGCVVSSVADDVQLFMNLSILTNTTTMWYRNIEHKWPSDAAPHPRRKEASIWRCIWDSSHSCWFTCENVLFFKWWGCSALCFLFWFSSPDMSCILIRRTAALKIQVCITGSSQGRFFVIFQTI